MRTRRGKPYSAAQSRNSDKSEFVPVRPVAEISDIWFQRTGQRLSDAHIRMILISGRRKIAAALQMPTRADTSE